MALLSSQQHLGIALPTLSSLNLTTDAPAHFPSFPPSYHCCSRSQLGHSSSSSGLIRVLDARFRARNPMRGSQRARAVVSDAAATQSEADDEAAEALTMYIKMEGTFADTSGSRISKTLEGMEGVSNVKVSLEEGMATVEVTKKTNIQATGVASELVDAVQKTGFKMQSLYLGFDDEETNEDDALYFGSSSAMDEAEIAAI
ncbi:hypothetical protein O6H91_01G013200 [Diphasiastrum complanatum]|uniref:Uncharacterized protein n=1 Tax=Diphasiastrum complanatum TaxID=34168 RepID=A0ACC2ENF1_DIPCM|nr:hypothetical protein O6H91_01G013200 [Diphasiastrum complanatum]